MAAQCCRWALRPFRNTHFSILTRQYGIRPPKWLGGKLWPHEKNELPGLDGVTKSYNEIIAEHKAEDPDLTKPINIGEEFKLTQEPRKVKYAQWKANRANKELEQKARLQKLQIPLDEVKAGWLKEHGPLHMQWVAEHFGIYQDLFDGAYFVPAKIMNIFYDYDDEFVTPVYRGNKIPSAEAATEPTVEFESEPQSLWTLIMTNPDGHLTDNTAEYLHWFIGNIPGNDVSKGEVICDYLQPFPPRGTGFHRHIFLLFKQEKHMDYSSEKRPPNCASLKERTFRTFDFYSERQDDLTPVGLNFFQSEWDHSIREVYHNILKMREPSFEYKHQHHYIAPQKRYAHRQPFDRYYDRYRDRKDIAEEVLKMKLKMISPFEEHPERPKYPLIHREETYKPTWLKRREEIMHRRLEQYKDLP